MLKVKVNSEVATGTGPNKKVAKRNAAEAMLLQLGYKASTIAASAPEVTIMSLTTQLVHTTLMNPARLCACGREQAPPVILMLHSIRRISIPRIYLFRRKMKFSTRPRRRPLWFPPPSSPAPCYASSPIPLSKPWKRASELLIFVVFIQRVGAPGPRREPIQERCGHCVTGLST